MKCFLGRTEVRVTWGVLPLFAFAIAAGEWKTLLLALLALSVHEAAHAVAARNLGCAIARVSVWPFGAVMTLDGMFGRADGEWIVALAGPLGSLAFSGMLKLIEALFDAGEPVTLLCRVSLGIGLLNLLPAFPLDGGRVCKALLIRAAGERTARTVLLAFTGVIAAGVLIAGVYLFGSGVPAWTLLFIPPFLLCAAFREQRTPELGIVSRVMDRGEALARGIPQAARIVVLPDGATLRDAVSAISGTRFTILFAQKGLGYAALSERQVLDAAAKFGPETDVNSVISLLIAGK